MILPISYDSSKFVQAVIQKLLEIQSLIELDAGKQIEYCKGFAALGVPASELEGSQFFPDHTKPEIKRRLYSTDQSKPIPTLDTWIELIRGYGWEDKLLTPNECYLELKRVKELLDPDEFRGYEDIVHEAFVPRELRSYFDDKGEEKSSRREWQWINDVENPLKELKNKKSREEREETSKEAKKDNFTRFYEFLVENYRERLKFNLLTRDTWLDGQIADLDLLYPKIRLEFGRSVTKDNFCSLIYLVASENPFHPFKDLLEASQLVEPVSLVDLAARYFGCLSPIANTMLKKWLISLIARVYDAGCKADSMLVLQGDQGLSKSQFFETLLGDHFYPNMDKFDKDDALGASRTVCAFVDEIDRIFGKKESATLKDWITRRYDFLREPYGRQFKQLKRGYVFAGSTNRKDFLKDSTGSRRYWIVPVSCFIPIELLKQERLGILRSAFEAYSQGQQWWLTPDEEKDRIEISEQFIETDPWLLHISKYLDGRTETTQNEILTQCLGIELEDQNQASSLRVRNILTQLNFCTTSKREGKKVVRVWKKSEISISPKSAVTTVTPNFSVPETFSGQGFESVTAGVTAIDDSFNQENLQSHIQKYSQTVTADVTPKTSTVTHEIEECNTVTARNTSTVTATVTVETIVTEGSQVECNSVTPVTAKFFNTEKITLKGGSYVSIGQQVKLPDGTIAEVVWLDYSSESVRLEGYEQPFSVYSLESAG